MPNALLPKYAVQPPRASALHSSRGALARLHVRFCVRFEESSPIQPRVALLIVRLRLFFFFSYTCHRLLSWSFYCPRTRVPSSFVSSLAELFSTKTPALNVVRLDQRRLIPHPQQRFLSSPPGRVMASLSADSQGSPPSIFCESIATFSFPNQRTTNNRLLVCGVSSTRSFQFSSLPFFFPKADPPPIGVFFPRAFREYGLGFPCFTLGSEASFFLYRELVARRLRDFSFATFSSPHSFPFPELSNQCASRQFLSPLRPPRFSCCIFFLSRGLLGRVRASAAFNPANRELAAAFSLVSPPF